jgi:hypothetical protein
MFLSVHQLSGCVRLCAGEQNDLEKRRRYTEEFLQVAARHQRRGRCRPTTSRYRCATDQVTDRCHTSYRRNLWSYYGSIQITEVVCRAVLVTCIKKALDVTNWLKPKINNNKVKINQMLIGITSITVCLNYSTLKNNDVLIYELTASILRTVRSTEAVYA